MMTRHLRLPTFSLPLLLISASLAASDLVLEPYFPLEPGARWSYENERFATEIEAEIVSRDGEFAIYRFGGREMTLRGDGITIDLTLADGELAPYYHFLEDKWIRRDLDECEDARDVRVVDRAAELETPIGIVVDVVVLEYGDPICSDAGRVREWWAPGVGLVQWEELNITGIVRWTITDFEISPAPTLRRGDVDADGAADISDAVGILLFLFAGVSDPLCMDAADADDDGNVVLTDAVFLLTWLFLGGDAPPAPGPSDCGTDPTADDLASCPVDACV